jgi:hypothetical protein
MVCAGRDPLTGRKRWTSRQDAGTGRAALKEAKQIEAHLLAEVAVGRHQDDVKVAELVDRWLEWRQAVKPMSPGTAANYRRCIDLKIKPDAYVFSHAADGSKPIRPDGVSHRFTKLASVSGCAAGCTTCGTSWSRSWSRPAWTCARSPAALSMLTAAR